jgi:hypothetical protein
LGAINSPVPTVTALLMTVLGSFRLTRSSQFAAAQGKAMASENMAAAEAGLRRREVIDQVYRIRAACRIQKARCEFPI